MVKSTESKEGSQMMFDIQKLCSFLWNQFQDTYFMDNPSVSAAIHNNDPTKLTKLTNIFIDQALNHISKINHVYKQVLKPEFKQYLHKLIVKIPTNNKGPKSQLHHNSR